MSDEMETKGTTVYVGNLRMDVRRKDIDELFNGDGKIVQVTMKRMFAFVIFEKEEEALAAVKKHHDTNFMGKTLRVEISIGKKREARVAHTEYRLTVDNIPHGLSWQALKEYMEKAGEIVFADVARDERGRSLGYGVVEYSRESDMEFALRRMQDSFLRGRRIHLSVPRRRQRRRFEPYDSDRYDRENRDDRYYGRRKTRGRYEDRRRSPRRTPPRRRSSRSPPGRRSSRSPPRRRASRSPPRRPRSPKRERERDRNRERDRRSSPRDVKKRRERSLSGGEKNKRRSPGREKARERDKDLTPMRDRESPKKKGGRSGRYFD